MTTLRNVVLGRACPVDDWRGEAIEAVIDRGLLSDWRDLAHAIRPNPWGCSERHWPSVDLNRVDRTQARCIGVLIPSQRFCTISAQCRLSTRSGRSRRGFRRGSASSSHWSASTTSFRSSRPRWGSARVKVGRHPATASLAVRRRRLSRRSGDDPPRSGAAVHRPLVNQLPSAARAVILPLASSRPHTPIPARPWPTMPKLWAFPRQRFTGRSASLRLRARSSSVRVSCSPRSAS
jgi:hypothetical protein